MLGLLLVTSACRNEPSRTSAATEEAADMQTQQRDAYVKITKTKLDAFDRKIDDLDTWASKMTEPEKKDFERTVQALRDQRKEVDTKLDDLKSVSVDSWTRMKAAVDASMGKLEQSYLNVAKKLHMTSSTTSGGHSKSY